MLNLLTKLYGTVVELVSANLRTDNSPDSENIELVRTAGLKTRLFERRANSRQCLTVGKMLKQVRHDHFKT